MTVPAAVIAAGSLGAAAEHQGRAAVAMGIVTVEWVLLFYFLSACAWLAVTPRDVTVGNRLRRYVIPRHLVAGVRTAGYGTRGELEITGRKPLDIAVVNTSASARRNQWAESRGIPLVEQMLDAVQPQPSQGRIIRATRYGHIGLLAAAAAGLVWLYVLLR